MSAVRGLERRTVDNNLHQGLGKQNIMVAEPHNKYTPKGFTECVKTTPETKDYCETGQPTSKVRLNDQFSKTRKKCSNNPADPYFFVETHVVPNF